MTPVVRLAARSLWSRRGAALLTVVSIAISVSLFAGVQKIRSSARESFASTLSGTDLIVGARSGPINLLLYAVFRIGDATANVSWNSYQLIAGHRDVAWTVPISLGDSHRGFRVLGTTADYFTHYRHGDGRRLDFRAGAPFADLYDVVLGAEVADKLGYGLGDRVVVSHGLVSAEFADHADKPFRVAGILAPTGTPVDRTVHVSLDAISAIHLDWSSGRQALPGQRIGAGAARTRDLTPHSITAFLIGMKSRTQVFQMQRAINEFREEPLLAILPGIVLEQLWDVVGVADRALLAIAAFVVLGGLVGMLTTLLASLNERRREMAVLRSVGAGPRHVFLLLAAESGLLTACGVALGALLTLALIGAGKPILSERFGLVVDVAEISGSELLLLAAIALAGIVVGTIPAWRAYRNTLADGLTMRI